MNKEHNHTNEVVNFGSRKQSIYGKQDTLTTQTISFGNHLRRYNWTEIERVDVTDLQIKLKRLKPFTQYEILLQAFNRHGRGPVAKIEAFTAGDGKILMISKNSAHDLVLKISK